MSIGSAFFALTLLGVTAPTAPPPAEGVRAGQRAPDFTLQTDEGKAFTLSRERGRSAVLLAFYPKDFTGGWTQELSEFRDHHARFQSKGVRVVGISTDGVDSHRKFREKLGLPFALLADPGGRISGRYDALMPIPGVRLASRKLVLVGRDGVIAYRDDAYEVGDAADWKALMAAVDALPARPAR